MMTLMKCYKHASRSQTTTDNRAETESESAGEREDREEKMIMWMRNVIRPEIDRHVQAAVAVAAPATDASTRRYSERGKRQRVWEWEGQRGNHMRRALRRPGFLCRLRRISSLILTSASEENGIALVAERVCWVNWIGSSSSLVSWLVGLLTSYFLWAQLDGSVETLYLILMTERKWQTEKGSCAHGNG